MTFTEILEYAIKNKDWLGNPNYKFIIKYNDNYELFISVYGLFISVIETKKIGTLNDILFSFNSKFCQCWFGNELVCEFCGKNNYTQEMVDGGYYPIIILTCCDCDIKRIKLIPVFQYHQRQLLGKNETEVCEYLGRFK